MTTVTALDVNPRRCLFCATTIHLCMGFVLARDILPYMQAVVAGLPLPRTKVREVCGRCVHIWDRIVEEANL